MTVKPTQPTSPVENPPRVESPPGVESPPRRKLGRPRKGEVRVSPVNEKRRASGFAPVNVWIPTELKRRMKRAALMMRLTRRGYSMSAFVEEAIQEKLDRMQLPADPLEDEPPPEKVRARRKR